MSRVLLPFPAHRAQAAQIAQATGARLGQLQWRHFPDGESLVTIDTGLQGCDVALLASLLPADALALPLRFAAQTAREFGARSVGLVAPYLAYMRQDARFHPGEAVSAPLFASFLEESFDFLIAADPHLHRHAELSELYRIPCRRVATAPLVADWIGTHVPDAVLIGPDSESSQWVGEIAARAGVPFQVLAKIRRGDREVEVSLPDPERARGRRPVIVDDIVSSGRTAIETIGQLRRLGLEGAVCIAIHAVFAGDACHALLAAGAARVVSCDTVPHPTNAIACAPLLAGALAQCWRDIEQG